MSLILQIQDIVWGPIKDLYFELTGGQLPDIKFPDIHLPDLPPVGFNLGPDEIGNIDIAPSLNGNGSTFGGFSLENGAQTSSIDQLSSNATLGNFSSPEGTFSSIGGDLSSGQNINQVLSDLSSGTTFGDLSSLSGLNDLSSVTDPGSSNILNDLSSVTGNGSSQFGLKDITNGLSSVGDQMSSGDGAFNQLSSGGTQEFLNDLTGSLEGLKDLSSGVTLPGSSSFDGLSSNMTLPALPSSNVNLPTLSSDINLGDLPFAEVNIPSSSDLGSSLPTVPTLSSDVADAVLPFPFSIIPGLISNLSSN